MKHGSLFSGIGGFDLAAQWMGWENVFHCEWSEFPRKVLKHHFPNSISYGDITKTDFTKHNGEIDIISGGFPCQPFSSAGKRKGTEDDRYLWDEMLRAIREIQPAYVVAENVRGLTNWNGGMVFDKVQTDLEAEGFEVLSFLLPACATNASHIRERIWFVAHSVCGGLQKSHSQFRQINGLPIKASNQFAGGATTQWSTGRRNTGMLCRSNGLSKELDGITFSEWRKESIKALGNAIVPQVAFEIFKAIEASELTTQPQTQRQPHRL